MSQTAYEQEALAPCAAARRVLIVENDPEQLLVVQSALLRAGFAVTALKRGEDALALVGRTQPHLVMLDCEYPGLLTTKLIRYIQQEAPAQRTRLMALSLYSSEQQIVSGFELGIDDYVVKPCSAPVLVARVRAILRGIRSEPAEPRFLDFHRLRMDLIDLRVMVDDQIVPLRPMQYRLLEFLMRHPERVFSREQVLNRIWSGSPRVDQRTVDVNVQRTRKALARFGCGNYLQTVRGFGYRLSALASQP